MAITLKRQLTPDEKATILKRWGRKDWVTGFAIPEGDPLHFDHIHPFAVGGVSEVNNIAPLTQATNLKKGRLTLEEFRTKLRMERFFDTGERLTLGDLLRHMKEKEEIATFGQPIDVTVEGGSARIRTTDLKEYVQPVQTCPVTKWRYFYATLPVELIDSDDDSDQGHGLQPRFLIFDKVFDLYRHFMNHPVLQPSVGRMMGQKVHLFDGQHKIAGLLFEGRRAFDCKIYLEADLRLLNETNISAHDKFAQTRFFSSVMVMKLGTQFGRDFEEYKAEEDGKPKSEEGFLNWLRKRDPNEATTASLNKRLRSFLYNSVLDDADNKLRPFVSVENRSNARTPLTMDQLDKSLLSDFLWRQASSDDMAGPGYRREAEFENMIALMNALYDNAMHRWRPDAPKGDEEQLALNRLVGSKSMQAWSDILRGAILAKLDLHDGDERERPFYRTLSDESQAKIDKIVRRLVEWQGWTSPASSDFDGKLSDNVGRLRQFFREKGLTTGYLMGASE